ncbi:MAG: metal-binding protein [Acidobacteriota bacterium]
MPSGKTHDLITLLLAPPTLLVAYLFTADLQLSAIATGTMLFGGLMFGPDLDIDSRPYKRWGPLRILWWPYRTFFPHRSRFTHGIILGTLVRIAYFLLVIALLLAIGLYLRELWLGGAPRGEVILLAAATRVQTLLITLDRPSLLAIFLGLWWGAASHTIADLFITTVKQISKSL